MQYNAAYHHDCGRNSECIQTKFGRSIGLSDTMDEFVNQLYPTSGFKMAAIWTFQIPIFRLLFNSTGI